MKTNKNIKTAANASANNSNEADLRTRCFETMKTIGVHEGMPESSVFEMNGNKETINADFSQEEIEVCLANHFNGIPMKSIYMAHIVSQSNYTEEYRSTLLENDKVHRFSQVQHMVYVLPDSEYDKIGKASEPAVISEAVFNPIPDEAFNGIDKELLAGMFGFSHFNEAANEYYHLMRKEELDMLMEKDELDDLREQLNIDDRRAGRTGIVVHYFHIINDEVADKILNA